MPSDMPNSGGDFRSHHLPTFGRILPEPDVSIATWHLSTAVACIESLPPSTLRPNIEAFVPKRLIARDIQSLPPNCPHAHQQITSHEPQPPIHNIDHDLNCSGYSHICHRSIEHDSDRAPRTATCQAPRMRSTIVIE
jgi:hypothetical protein